ncbi:MAG TPA: DUF1643 domain-containing protein [Mycobacteriales bacterium]|nr:DUF1643 domain-containing protein [Mycobacteriales bacterium]
MSIGISHREYPKSEPRWIAGGALLSHPERPGAQPLYRYALERWWDTPGAFVLWVMLNPSTGTASDDDPTIQRVVQRTRHHFPTAAGLKIVNLFAWRGARPSALAPVGFDAAVGNPHNDEMVRSFSASAVATVVGWGRGTGVPRDWLLRRERDVAAILNNPLCLGVTDGRPRHPKPQNQTQLPLNAPLLPWSVNP